MQSLDEFYGFDPSYGQDAALPQDRNADQLRQAVLDARIRSGLEDVSIGRPQFGGGQRRFTPSEGVITPQNLLPIAGMALGGAAGALSAGARGLGWEALKAGGKEFLKDPAERLFELVATRGGIGAVTGAAGGMLMPGIASADQPTPAMLGTGGAANAGEALRRRRFLDDGTGPVAQAAPVAPPARWQPPPPGEGPNVGQPTDRNLVALTIELQQLGPQGFGNRYGTTDPAEAWRRIQIHNALPRPGIMNLWQTPAPLPYPYTR